MMMLPIRTLWSFQEGFNTIEATMSATGIPPFIMQLLSQNLIGEFVNILVAASDKYDARFVEPSTQKRAVNSGI